MKNLNGKIYLTQEAYEQLENNVRILTEKLYLLTKERDNDVIGEAEVASTYDATHRLLCEINDKYEMLNNAIIVEKSGNSNIVDIEDYVTLVVKNGNNSDEMTVQLVGDFGDISGEILKISINSPMGKAIYKKMAGDKTSYTVEDERFEIEIIEKFASLNHTR